MAFFYLPPTGWLTSFYNPPCYQMISATNKKAKNAFEELISRESYLVTQANDLAKAFGNLSSVEHKVLDYCFSHVKAQDTRNIMYTDNLINLIYHLGLNKSGDSYKRIADALRSLNLADCKI